MKPKVGPRIYCIPATEADVVAVFRRGPSDWSHVGRWDLASGRYEPGAWLRGRVFPRRSDLSPDGRFLCYFAHKPTASWEQGDSFIALSKLPWLTALHAFGCDGTWTRGCYFTADGPFDAPGDAELPIPYGLRSNPVVQFASERRRGWEEAADSPPRDPEDLWDQHRNARMQKLQPGGKRWLRVTSVGHAGGEFGVDQAVDGFRVAYSLESEGELLPLEDVQWADWSRDGKLLVATRSGKIQVREPGDALSLSFDFEEDLSFFEPDPVEAPTWARRW